MFISDLLFRRTMRARFMCYYVVTAIIADSMNTQTQYFLSINIVQVAASSAFYIILL